MISGQTPHYDFLDGLRGLVAVTVVLYHASEFSGLHLVSGGYLAVDFFFVLSGFVVDHAYGARISAGMRPREFAAGRIGRLYPTYAAALLAGLLTEVAISAAGHAGGGRFAWLALKAAFNGALLPLPTPHDTLLYPFDGAAWSLLFELVGNGVFFFILSRRRLGFSIYMMAGAIGALAFAAFRTGSIDHGSHAPWALIGLARMTVGFFAGAWLHRQCVSNSSCRAVSVSVSCLAVLALVATMLVPCARSLVPWRDLVSVTLIFPAVIYVGARSMVPQSVMWLTKAAADASYPLYLFHPPGFALLMMFWQAIWGATHTNGPVLFTISSLALLVTTSLLWARHPEVSLRRILRSCLSSTKRPRIGSAALRPDRTGAIRVVAGKVVM